MSGCFAVIDLGSNSVRMSINRLEKDGTYRVLEKVRATVRLGEGMGRDNFLREDVMARVADTIEEFCRLAKKYKCASVAAIATAALRKAENKAVFLEKVRKQSGIDFEVISGEQEAYYSYLAVKETVGIENGVIFDTGGGSTEITLVKNGEIKHTTSLPLGAVMLTEMMQNCPNMQMYKYVASHIGKISWLGECESLPLYGIGGSARAMAMIYKKRLINADELDGIKIPYAQVAKIYQRIFNTPPQKRKEIKGMDPSRADIILAGLTPVKVLMDMTGSRSVCICASGVKEGVFFRMKNEILGRRK